jgi:hypothetical protein
MKHEILIITTILLISFSTLFSLNGVSGESSVVTQVANDLAQQSLAAQREIDLDWTQRFPENFPTPRAFHASAYDSIRGVTVLFGGSGKYGHLSDTWEWNGTEWIQCFPANSPSGVYAPAMVYDSARQRIVLFGGYSYIDGPLFHNDTWEWDGTNWTQMSPGNSPQGRSRHAMAYDSARGVTVLFGGMTGIPGTTLSDTWEWDGTNWTQHNPANKPTKRSGHAMAYDSARGVTVLFGGSGSEGGGDQTWEWDGTNWLQHNPVQKPPSRSTLAMAYDSNRGVTVLFGGYPYTNDTWEWNGTNWTQRIMVTSPSKRQSHTMVYDSTRGVTVLFGGYYEYQSGGDTYKFWYGQTWEYGVVSGPEPESSMIFLPLILR